MEQDQPTPTPLPNLTETPSAPVPKDSQGAETPSEEFGNQEQQISENLSNFPKLKEPTAAHTATVRTAAKTFEQKGHPVTERSILNWCRPTSAGDAKLDCAWDKNQKKYYITPESLELLMETMPKAQPVDEPNNIPKEATPSSETDSAVPNPNEANAESIPKDSEPQENLSESDSEKDAELRRLQRKLAEANLTIDGKNYILDEFQKDREKLMDRLVVQSEEVGRLNSELKALGSGHQEQQPTKADVREATDAEVVEESEENQPNPPPNP